MVLKKKKEGLPQKETYTGLPPETKPDYIRIFSIQCRNLIPFYGSTKTNKNIFLMKIKILLKVLQFPVKKRV